MDGGKRGRVREGGKDGEREGGMIGVCTGGRVGVGESSVAKHFCDTTAPLEDPSCFHRPTCRGVSITSRAAPLCTKEPWEQGNTGTWVNTEGHEG